MSQKIKAIKQWNLVKWWNVMWKIFFFKNHAESKTERIVRENRENSFIYEIKPSGKHLVSIHFGRPPIGYTKKTNSVTFHTVNPSFWLYDFSRKIFLFMIHSINWLNFIAWFILPLEILGNMCIVNILLPFCDVINFEISLSFLIKPLS